MPQAETLRRPKSPKSGVSKSGASTESAGKSTAKIQATHPWCGLPASKFLLTQRAQRRSPA